MIKEFFRLQFVLNNNEAKMGGEGAEPPKFDFFLHHLLPKNFFMHFFAFLPYFCSVNNENRADMPCYHSTSKILENQNVSTIV